jgi:excinuclease ABC subunit A
MLKRYYADSSSEKIRQWAEDFMVIADCPVCEGSRLKKESMFFKVNEKSISDLSNMDIRALHEWIGVAPEGMSQRQRTISQDIIKELRMRLGFLLDVGLDYLSLNRPARTLSGGESQRIRLATQIGSQLTGITYILDEPSIGLHQRDNEKLIQALRELADIGNTVLVVEHDKDIMLASDYLMDLGPKAGKFGGEIVAEGTPEEFLRQKSITADYLSGRSEIEVPKKRRKGSGKKLKLVGARGNNLKNVTLEIPLGKFICVSGVSGSGKSTLINDTLYPILRQHFYNSVQKPLEYDSIEGIDLLDKVIEIDQEPIGRTPRSNPVTFVG